jgi:nucleoid-associated protein YgaU
MLFCCIVSVSLCAIQVRGQDVAEAARQEKPLKAAGQNSPRHVYTEEDLKRKTILTPEDQARVEARKRQQGTAPAQQNAQQRPNDANPQSESLGEIARRYRQEKAAHEAELAAKKKFTPFPYKVPESSLAEPKPEGEPRIAPGLPSGMENRSATPERHLVPHFRPPVTGPRLRISPFQPRPLAPEPSIPPAGLTARPAVPVRPSREVGGMEGTISPEPMNSGTRRIEVQPGQSWWKLAELYLGDGVRWPELRKLNAAGGSPELLKSGSSVLVLVVAKHAKASAQVIEVRRGETLWSLAKEHFGRGAAWTCLATANPRITDYTHLAVGTLLTLPEGEVLNPCQNRFSLQLRK